MPKGAKQPRMLVLGRVSGLYGVRGWVKVHSDTEPRDNILRYQPWYLGGGGTELRLVEGRRHGKCLVARVEGCEDRDQAAVLVGQKIAVRRDQLPALAEDEFYWADLEGLDVETLGGEPLGRVNRLFATPSNDVMVVAGEQERLIPFLWHQVIKDVDLDLGRIKVDWDPDF